MSWEIRVGDALKRLRAMEYAAIARARIKFWAEHPTGLPVDAALQAEARRRRVRDSGQLGLGV